MGHMDVISIISDGFNIYFLMMICLLMRLMRFVCFVLLFVSFRYLLRLFRYLFVIDEIGLFVQVMGHMDVISIISDGFNIYFPMMIVGWWDSFVSFRYLFRFVICFIIRYWWDLFVCAGYGSHGCDFHHFWWLQHLFPNDDCWALPRHLLQPRLSTALRHGIPTVHRHRQLHYRPHRRGQDSHQQGYKRLQYI